MIPSPVLGKLPVPEYRDWDFLHRHRQKLSHQGRMGFILKNLDQMDEAELNGIRQQAIRWHQRYNSHPSTMA